MCTSMYYRVLVLLVLSCISIFKFTISLIVNDKYKPQIVNWSAHFLVLDPSYSFNNLVRKQSNKHLASTILFSKEIHFNQLKNCSKISYYITVSVKGGKSKGCVLFSTIFW